MVKKKTTKKAKANGVQSANIHIDYDRLRKEVESAQRAGPIVRLVKLGAISELGAVQHAEWCWRLQVERELLQQRYDKQTGQSHAAEAAREKCRKLLRQNAADLLRLKAGGDLWQALVLVGMDAGDAYTRVIRLERGLAGMFGGVARAMDGEASR